MIYLILVSVIVFIIVLIYRSYKQKRILNLNTIHFNKVKTCFLGTLNLQDIHHHMCKLDIDSNMSFLFNGDKFIAVRFRENGFWLFQGKYGRYIKTDDLTKTPSMDEIREILSLFVIEKVHGT